MSNFGNFASVGGALADFASAEYFRDKSSDEATANRNWQADMSGSAHQREVRDLMAAGLNPMLSARLGGASTPGGSMGAPGSAAPGSSFNQSRLVTAEVALKEAQGRNVTAESRRNEAIADILEKIAPKILSGMGAIENSAGALGEATGRLQQLIEKALQELPGQVRELLKEIPGGLREILNEVLSRVPQLPKLAPVEVAREIKKTVEERSRMPAAVKQAPFGAGEMSSGFSAWGLSEYERAQRERFERARQSPASIRRGGK